MNWEAVGVVSEIVGATAVVISLLYLARQLQIQNAESRSSAMHEFYVGWRESATSFADTGMGDLYVRASEDFDSLSQSEKICLIGVISGPVRLFEEAFFHHRQNRLSADMWDAINRQYSALFSNAVYQRYWTLRHDWFTVEFQQHVDVLVKREYRL
jgi:hypothetical protein